MRTAPCHERPKTSADDMYERIRNKLLVILQTGTKDYSKTKQRRLVIVNFLALLIFLASLNYAAIYAINDFDKYKVFVFFNLALCCLALLVPLGHRINDIAGGLMVAGFEYIGLFVLTGLLGRDSGIQMNYIIGAAVPFLCLELRAIRLIIAVVLAGFALHVVAWFAFPPENALFEGEPILVANVYIFSAVTAFGLIAATVYYAFRLKDEAEDKTEALLQNLLPAEIAERIRENPEESIAQNYSDATVLFADLVGFTALAQSIGAEKTVDLLNRIFTGFDQLADELSLEKIKTIGDAYMIAGGVPEEDKAHHKRVAEMALRMNEMLEGMHQGEGHMLQLRIGISCGPLLAGVIGQRKPTYDVWGDTVNLASRMEGSGQPGRIHITTAFVGRINERFTCLRRGQVEIRGFGPLETWYLTGRK